MRTERCRALRAVVSPRLVVLCLSLWLLPDSVRAQDAGPAETDAIAEAPLVTDTVQVAESSSPLQGGFPAAATPTTTRVRGHRERRVYFGMWTLHLKDDVLALKNNWVAGLSAGGFFGATFLNTFGRRAFSGGIQRPLIRMDRGGVGAVLGYRLGFVTGYDGRLMSFARKTPVLPLLQPFVSLDFHRMGVEVSYTFVVVSSAATYRF